MSVKYPLKQEYKLLFETYSTRQQRAPEMMLDLQQRDLNLFLILCHSFILRRHKPYQSPYPNSYQSGYLDPYATTPYPCSQSGYPSNLQPQHFSQAGFINPYPSPPNVQPQPFSTGFVNPYQSPPNVQPPPYTYPPPPYTYPPPTTYPPQRNVVPPIFNSHASAHSMYSFQNSLNSHFTGKIRISN